MNSHQTFAQLSSPGANTNIPQSDFIVHQNMITPKSEHNFVTSQFSQQNAMALPNFNMQNSNAPPLNSITVPNGNVHLVMTPQGLIAVPQLSKISISNLNVASTSDRNVYVVTPHSSSNSVQKRENLLEIADDKSTEETSNASLVSSQNQDESYKHKCEHCGKKFKYDSYLNSHLKTHLPKKKRADQKHECSVCKAVLSNRRSYKRHELIHLDVKPIFCEICKKPFKNRHAMKTHMTLHTNERVFKCEICSSTFRTKASLKKHTIELHKGNSKHVCEICNKGFAYASNLKYHINFTHKKTFVCGICNANCTTSYMYQKHQLVHKGITKTKNYVCEMCKRAFVYQSELRKHVRIVHEGIKKQFICDICGKATSSPEVLESHKLRHKGIRPFQCNNCGKMFYTKKELKWHAITHTGEKPFSCKICEKKFTQKGTLNIHMRLHTGEKPFKCNLCKKAFVSRSLLNSHKKSKHLIT